MEPGRPLDANQRSSGESLAESLAPGLVALRRRAKQATKHPSAAAPADQATARRTLQPCRVVVITVFSISEGLDDLRLYPLASVIGWWEGTIKRVVGMVQNLPNNSINLHNKKAQVESSSLFHLLTISAPSIVPLTSHPTAYSGAATLSR